MTHYTIVHKHINDGDMDPTLAGAAEVVIGCGADVSAKLRGWKHTEMLDTDPLVKQLWKHILKNIGSDLPYNDFPEIIRIRQGRESDSMYVKLAWF